MATRGTCLPCFHLESTWFPSTTKTASKCGTPSTKVGVVRWGRGRMRGVWKDVGRKLERAMQGRFGVKSSGK